MFPTTYSRSSAKSMSTASGLVKDPSIFETQVGVPNCLLNSQMRPGPPLWENEPPLEGVRLMTKELVVPTM